MRVSVILCTYSLDMYDHFTEAADAVLEQTHDDVELVVVVDGNDDLCERVHNNYDGRDSVIIHCNDRNRGLSYGRNKGAELASGDVVAFLDDDAVPAEDWVERLVEIYEMRDVTAVGGKMVPKWEAGQPRFLPAEFYWLIGVTYRGFPEKITEVRNTFSSNLSFRRNVFRELGGFKENMGKRGENNLQGGETELCARLYREYGERVTYTPKAEVAHKVFDYRTKPSWLAKRAFWQGYSKRRMDDFIEDATDTEFDFLRRLSLEFVPKRVRSLIGSPSFKKAGQLFALFALTACVGVGYVYALLTG